MPAVAAGAVATGLASAFSISAAGVAFSVGTFLSTTAISLALGGLSYALQDKPRPVSADSYKGGITQQFRQAVTYREVVYGEVRKSGPMTVIEMTEDNKYEHYFLTLASHEITAVEEFLVNDESITPDMIDTDGMVTDGSYAGKLRLKIHLGSDDQTADDDMVAEVERWTSYHRQRGCAYIYARLEWDANVYSGGTPNISVWLRGKPCIDTRNVVAQTNRFTEDGDERSAEDTTLRFTEDVWDTAPRIYSANVALQVFDHLTDRKWGMRVRHRRIDEGSADAAANICDEIVSCKNVQVAAISADPATGIITLEGDVLRYARGDQVSLAGNSIGGLSEAANYYVIPYQRQDTPRIKLANSLDNAMQGIAIDILSDGSASVIKDGEPRYHGGGVLTMEAERGQNLQEIATAMGGYAVNTGGHWVLKAAAYESPVYAMDESDLAGPLEIIQTRAGMHERFNTITGLYADVANKGNATDYPVISSDTYIAEDGEALPQNLDLTWVNRSQAAQRLAKNALELSRRDLIFKAPFKLNAIKLRCRDNFYFSFAPAGWENMVFQITHWRLYHRDQDGVPEPVIELTCQIMDSAAYAFNSVDDEISTKPAPRTSLGSAHKVEAVKGFSLESIPVDTLDGDKTYKIKASWRAPVTQHVTSGGSFEITFKKQGAAVWTSFPPVRGDATETDLFQAELDTLYDFEICAINALGQKGPPVPIDGFEVGSSASADTQDWQYETLPAEDWQNDSLPAEDWN